MNTGFFEYYPFIYSQRENSTGRIGVHGVERIITETSAKAINFSFTVKVQNVTSQEVLEGLISEYIDFAVSTFLVEGNPDSQLRTSTFI